MRIGYRRTAFQHNSHNDIRISLDTDITMISELEAPKAPGDWCRDMRAPLNANEVVHFPYALLELKLQVEAPDWVQELLESGEALSS